MHVKRFLFAIVSVFVFVLAFAGIARAQEYPKSVGIVNDFAGLLSADERASIENTVKDCEARTTVEIAVVTVTTLHGYSVEQYTRGIATAWGVGKKGKDNGIVLLVAPNERKVRIELADGVPNLNGTVADLIIQDEILPQMRAKRYNLGIIAGVNAIVREVQAPKSKPFDVTKIPFRTIGLILLAGAILVFIRKTRAWHQRKREILKQCQALLENILRERLKAISALEVLERDYRRTNWTSLKQQLAKIEERSLREQFASLKKRLDATWLSSEQIHRQLTDFIDEVESGLKHCREVVTALSSVEGAKSETQRLLEVIPQRIRTIRSGVDHPDVRKKPKNLRLVEEYLGMAMMQIGSAESDKAESYRTVPETDVDWPSVHHRLAETSDILDAIEAEIDSDILMAKRARTDGPSLLKKMRGMIQSAEHTATSERARPHLETARKSYEQALALSAVSNNVDWLPIHALLIVASQSINDAEAATSFERRHESSWSPSSYSGSAGSFGGGGFSGGGFGGGGGFSGGGASGGW